MAQSSAVQLYMNLYLKMSQHSSQDWCKSIGCTRPWWGWQPRAKRHAAVRLASDTIAIIRVPKNFCRKWFFKFPQNPCLYGMAGVCFTSQSQYDKKNWVPDPSLLKRVHFSIKRCVTLGLKVLSFLYSFSQKNSPLSDT